MCEICLNLHSALDVNSVLPVWICRLVSGAGDIKLTKDGNVLLHEMVSKILRCETVSSIVRFSSLLKIDHTHILSAGSL